MILELQHRRPDGDVDTYHLKPGRRYHLGRGSACEVRILDLKLSRKHAALEFQEGEWKLIDLCSTNGCQLNGALMVGTSPLREGHVIEIGQTSLTIGPITAKQSPSASSSGAQRAIVPAPSVVEIVAPVNHEHTSYISDEFRPPSHGHDSGALSPLKVDQQAPTVAAVAPVIHAEPPRAPREPEPPARRTNEPRRPTVTPVIIAQAPASFDLDDTVATVPPAVAVATPPPAVRRPAPPPFVAPAPKAIVAAGPLAGVTAPGAASNSDERSYFITVLGRRVGPLSRAVARDLKSRELKGVLKPSELDAYPQA